MPYFSIETNRPVDTVGREAFLEKASAFAAELLGKPESYVMVGLKSDLSMSFAGKTEPAAFVRLYSIGLSSDRCEDFSRKICTFLEEELAIAPDRTYIDFRDLKRSMFGWNAKTF